MINRVRGVAAALGLTLAAGLAIVALPTAAHSAEQAPTALWSETEAVAAAQKHDSRVEVMSKATESTKVFANPDGTFTLEESLQPHRVRDGETGWKPIDTTLQTVDGRLQAAATVNAVSFSGGGDSPLATIEEDGKRVTMSWPGSLPQPVLDGSTATYSEVLIGIDLQMTATATGFTQVLVVKSREAAANPALKELRLGFDTAGLRVSENAAGGLEAADEAGNVVFTAPTPTMWDSSSSAGLRTLSAEGSVPEAKQAQVEVGLTGDTLSLAPDQRLLEAADTVYPVYIDPSWSGWKNNWTSVWKAYPGTSYWNAEKINWDDDDNGVARSGYESQTGMTVRSFFEMNLQGVMGKQVLGATMRITQTHNWSCSGTPVDLLQTGAISPSTTWDNQPWLSLVTTAWTDLGNSGCGKPDGDIEFDVTSVVKTHADNGWGAVTLALKAPDEGNTNQWKRFRNNPVIAVNYNSVPGAPTDLRVDGRGSSDPRPIVGTATPTLTARVHDADPGDTLTAGYGWYKLGTDGNWSLVGSAMQGNLRGGDLTQHTITTPLEHEGVYRFHVEAWDAHLTGPKSQWMEFQVDLEGPQTAPKVDSADYPYGLDQTHGAVGKTGTFTFSPNGESGIVGYHWGWNDPPANTVAAGPDGAVTVLLTPPPPSADDPQRGGQLTLYVASYDGSTRLSPLAAHTFNIGNATSAIGDWKLSDPAGSTTAADASGNGNIATVNGATLGSSSRLPNGPTVASLDGVDDSLTSSGPVLDTSKSFTVSAWVKLDDTAADRTAISQDGNRASAFALQYSKSAGRWAFAMHTSDTDDAEVLIVTSADAPKAGAWTHLAGVYDAGASRISLYLDGALAGNVAVSPHWNAGGPLAIGRAKSGGVWGEHWNGSVSEVKVWDRVVTAREIEPDSTQALGRWPLNRNGNDSTGAGKDATATADTTWVAGRNSSAYFAARLNGTSSYLETAGAVLRTNQSFEVSAWVKLAQAADGVQAAVSQDAGNTAAFVLGHDGASGRWLFAMAGDDNASNPALVQVVSDAPASIGQWVHLVGRFDAQTGAPMLYVNGQVQTSTTATTAGIDGQGKFAIGRAKASAGNANFFHGDIDDVEALAGLAADASGANVALRAPAYASSSAPSEWGWSLNQINDGLRGPLGWASWSSTDVDHEEWAVIRLPGKQAINRVDLYARSDGQYTGENFPADFTIEVWDGGDWMPVVSRTGYPRPTDGSAHTFTFDTRVTNEIVIRGHNVKLMQLAEVEVYRAVHRSAEETLTGNLAFGAGVSTSSDAPQDWGWSPAWVNDARQDRGWSSWSSTDVNHTEWIEFSLASTARVGRVDLHARSDGQYTGESFPANFTIQTWNGSSWVTVVSQTNYPKPTDGSAHIFEFEAQNTDRLRIAGTDLKIMIFAEVEIYGRQQ